MRLAGIHGLSMSATEFAIRFFQSIRVSRRELIHQNIRNCADKFAFCLSFSQLQQEPKMDINKLSQLREYTINDLVAHLEIVMDSFSENLVHRQEH